MKFRSRQSNPLLQKKMSDLLKEMGLTLFIDPERLASAEAVAAAVLFSHVAWNRSIGVPMPDKFFKVVLSDFETDNPNFWKELKFTDPDVIISKLIVYKQSHYPDDRRVIEACQGLKDKVRVAWHY